MSGSSADRDPLDMLAEEFIDRYRVGERPSLTEFVNRLPVREEEVRALFPALVVLEKLKPNALDGTGDYNAPAFSDPERLGEFRIVRRIGAGGMAVVYEAIQESLGRQVALKLLPTDALADRKRLERFRREAKAAGRLHHTNIVPVYGTGEAEGRHFYVMQFIAGHPLDAVIDEVRRLKAKPEFNPAAPPISQIAAAMLTATFCSSSAETPLAETPPHRPADSTASSPSLSGSFSDGGRHYWTTVARVGVQVADALAYAHGQGVLHRDIKPNNLLFDQAGTVWVTDFGLAKAAESNDLTQQGDIVGTLRYMAPERFDGQGDQRADVYSLGLTLYEMLTLRPAYNGEPRARLIEAVVAANPPKPRSIDAAIPRDLETIVLKAIQRDPIARYASAKDFADDLRRYVEDRPILARRATAMEQTRLWCRRNPAVASLTAAIFVLLVATAVVAVGFAVWRGRQLATTEGARNDATEARNEAMSRLRESYYRQAQGERWSGRAGRRLDSLQVLTKAAEIPSDASPTALELRNEAIASLALMDVGREPIWTTEVITPGVAMDPSLQHYAIWNDRIGEVYVRRRSDGTELAKFSTLTDSIWPVLFSPDGRYLAFSSRGPMADDSKRDKQHRLEVWDWRDGKRVLAACEEEVGALSFVFGPDCTRLFATWRGDKIVAYDLRAKQAPTLLAAKGKVVDVHPDGSRLATVTGRTVSFRDPATGQEAGKAIVAPSTIYSMKWSPNGKLVALGCANFRGYLYDAATGAMKFVLAGHQSEVPHVFFSPDSATVGTVDYEDATKLWSTRSGRLLLTLKGRVNGFSRDGTELSYYFGQIAGVRKVVSSRVYQELWGHVGNKIPRNARWLCDGRILASSGTDGTRLWNPNTGEQINLLPSGPGPIAVKTNAWYSGLGGDIFRWPIERLDSGERFRVGPPIREADWPERAVSDFSFSADGQWLGVAESHSQIVLRTTADPTRKITIGDQPELDGIRLSPDGRWAACWGWPAAWRKVYDVTTQTCVFEAHAGGIFEFSPDGKWLAFGGKTEAFLLEVGSWSSRRMLPIHQGIKGAAAFAFRPDGKLLAVVRMDASIQILDVATFQEYATLESPFPIRGMPRFSPDGTRLAVATTSQHVQVWDLLAIREELGKLGLDWGAAPLVVDPVSRQSPPKVEIIGADRVSAPSADAHELNSQAWTLLTGPPEQWEPAKALTLIQQAIRIRPNEPMFLNTLGVAQFRNGKNREALATFDKSLAAGKGEWDAFDLYFQAMCHARLGDQAKAKACFDRAAVWVEKKENINGEHDTELRQFRQEAEEVMGLNHKDRR